MLKRCLIRISAPKLVDIAIAVASVLAFVAALLEFVEWVGRP